MNCANQLTTVHGFDGNTGHGCSIASFEEGELGEVIPAAELPQHIRERVACAYMPAGPAAATPHLQAPLSASARMAPPATQQARLPCAPPLIAQLRLTHVLSMCMMWSM